MVVTLIKSLTLESRNLESTCVYFIDMGTKGLQFTLLIYASHSVSCTRRMFPMLVLSPDFI